MKSPYVIAIAGGSASGKSTLAASLFERLKTMAVCELIAMDRYMRRTDPLAPKVVVEGIEMFDANHPDSVDNAAVLHAIQNSPAAIVIVEGLMCLAVEELRSAADLRVFIDLDADVRSMRRMERDIRTKRSGGDPAFILAYYLACARVGHRLYVQPSASFADILVRGDADPVRTAALISQIALAER